MARWSHEDGRVHARIVYYGPACCGKTCNLEALHRVADVRRGQELLTVKTQKDHTLFFDLLPFALDDVLGYRIEVKLFTVPGQVRLDATRRVLLAGADVIVFVADSRRSQREKNIWSLQNLRMNMRDKHVDPERVPILFQINKRDAPDAAPAAEVAEWLGVTDEQVVPAVASRGEGVVETLRAACAEFLQRAPGPEEGGPPHPLARDLLEQALDRAFSSYAQRVSDGWPAEHAPRTPIVLAQEDPLESAIETSVRLGEERTAETARARRLAREADGFRRLGESLCEIHAGSERPSVIEAVLTIARDVLGAHSVTLIAESQAGTLVEEGSVGCTADPLLESASGRTLLRRVLAADGPCVIDDLADHCAAAQADLLERLRSVAAVTIPHEGPCAIVAYAARPDGLFEQDDVRFLKSVARHLAAGLEKTRAHEELARHRDRLEQTVTGVKGQPRARGSRRAVDRIRERFLGNLSSEMQAPLAAVVSAATAIRECKTNRSDRERLAGSIVSSAGLLQRQLEDLIRLVKFAEDEPLHLAEVRPERLVEKAKRLAGQKNVDMQIDDACKSARIDPDGLGRALGNLIDNAVKFSKDEKSVRVEVAPSTLATEEGTVGALRVSVFDRGPGVAPEDRERIFAPFATVGEAVPQTGMGIGLYEARCLAQRHGGTIEYAAREGGGSEFRVIVPLEPVAEMSRMEVSRG